jgi:hypothetical protein
LTNEDWQVIGELQAAKIGSDMSKKRKAHSFAIHGLLLLYLNNRETMEYAGVMQTVNAITDCVVGNA